MIRNFARLYQSRKLLVTQKMMENRRMKIYYRSGALKPMPEGNNFFGIVGVFCTVVPGILIGALISKNIASFLEENDLFVPEDEDDD